jgi:hypothetical protein
MTTIQIELSDATAKAAKAAGLLTKDALECLLQRALERKQVADRLLDVADRVEAASISPMSLDEMNAEVKTVRRERKQRARDLLTH